MRHGRPAWMVDGTGRDDPALSDLGERQVVALGEHVPTMGINEVWVSPLRRAQQTAAPFGGPARTLPFLEEVKTPSIEGMDREGIANRYRGARDRDYSAWWDGIEGGESNRAFVGRIGSGLDATFASMGFRWEDRQNHRIWYDIPRDGTIAIVCHAGTTGAALSHLLALPQVPWSWERFRLWHTGIAVVHTVPMSDGLIFSMDSFNNQEHLKPEERSR